MAVAPRSASGAQTWTDRVARRELRAAVNFGVASVARALGGRPSDMLDLRCECGRTQCAERVRITLRDYQGAELDRALLVAAEHADPSAWAFARTRYWAVVETGDDRQPRSAQVMRQRMPVVRSGEEAVRSRFVAPEHRPMGLQEVDVTRLTGYQRALLVNDGTVTRLVEASVLEPLEVRVLDQQMIAVEDDMWLDLPVPPAPLLRRRVQIHGCATRRLYVLAESLLVISRLPQAMIDGLASSHKGLGELLDEIGLERRRELLWFGYSTPPDWASAAARALPLLTRSYRIIHGGDPAILITESFPAPE